MRSDAPRVFDRKHTWLDPVLGPLERGIYRVTGVNPEEPMDWARAGSHSVWVGAF